MPPRALLCEGDTEEKCCDGADAGRNPIHVVQQIERVGEGDKPEHRCHDVHDVPRGQGEGCPGADQSDTHKGLKNELELWPQVYDVVNQTNGEHEDCAHDNRGRLERHDRRPPRSSLQR